MGNQETKPAHYKFIKIGDVKVQDIEENDTSE